MKLSLRQQYEALEVKRRKLCAFRQGGGNASPEIEAQIEEIELEQDAIASDIDHLVNGPSMDDY